jgi:hypothetical protein
MCSFLDYTGNKALVGLCSANTVLFVAMKFFYMWRNKVHKAHYDSLPPEEKINGIDFHYVH